MSSDITQKPPGVLWTPDGPRDLLVLRNRAGHTVFSGYTDFGDFRNNRLDLLRSLAVNRIIARELSDCDVVVVFPDGATGRAATLDDALEPFIRL